MSATSRTRSEDGRTPAVPIREKLPDCVLCTWAARAHLGGIFELKRLNKSCPVHRAVVAAEDSPEPVSFL